MQIKGKYSWLKHVDFMLVDLLALFLAFLFMGIPGGMVLKRRGYRFTAMLATGFAFAALGVQLASGQSPVVFESLAKGVNMTPQEYMLSVLNSERYEPVTA